VPTLISVVCLPFWPLIAKIKMNSSDDRLIKVVNRMYLYVVIVSIILSVVIFINDSWVIERWVDKSMTMEDHVRVGLMIFSVLASIGYAQSMVLNGLGEIQAQAKLYVWYLIVLIPFKVMMIYLHGLYGLIAAINIGYIVRIYFCNKIERSVLVGCR
jgi:O-antigen/teichoic acid export membrane protein